MSTLLIELYEKGKNKYEHHRALESAHPKKWNNFMDYLRFYNLSDCKPLSVAMLNSFNLFEKTFGINMFYEYSLAGFAQKAVFKLYNPNVPNIFSFPFKEVTELFRSNIYGGICNIFHRHITLMDEEAPYAAKFNSKGMLFLVICQTDFVVCCDQNFLSNFTILMTIFR